MITRERGAHLHGAPPPVTAHGGIITKRKKRNTMKRLTKREIEAAIELAEGQRDEAPEDTISRLRYCFPDLAESDLLAMALRHPDVMKARARSWSLKPHSMATGWRSAWTRGGRFSAML